MTSENKQTRKRADKRAMAKVDLHRMARSVEKRAKQLEQDCEQEKAKADPIGALLDRMNNKHAAVLLGGKFTVLSEVENALTGCPDVNFSSVADFQHHYRNKEKVPVKGGKATKYINCGTWWLDHPDRREFAGVVFDPAGKSNGYYNLWRGLAIEPEPGEWGKFREHIFANICSCNQDHFDWLLDWIADLFQNPGGRRPGTAIVLRGKQGTGKGVFTTNIGKPLGSHFVHVSGQHRLTGRFNNHLKAALLVFCDEGWWAGDKRDAGTLKALITEPTILVEPKFQDAFQVKSFMRVVMASNSSWVVPADLEERRFFVLDVDDERMQDHEFFAAIQQEMDHGGHAAMLFDLLDREIKSNLREAPRTGALFDQVVSSMDSLTAFWFGALVNERIGSTNGWPEIISKEDFRREYLAYCAQQRVQHPLNDENVSKKLILLCPKIKKTRPYVKDVRVHSYALPSLEDCRKVFQAAVRMGDEIWPRNQDDD